MKLLHLFVGLVFMLMGCSCESRLYGILGDYPYIYANITLIDAHSAELTSLATLRQYYTPTVVSLQLVKATSDMHSQFYGIVVDLEKQNNVSYCSSESVSGNAQQSLTNSSFYNVRIAYHPVRRVMYITGDIPGKSTLFGKVDIITGQFLTLYSFPNTFSISAMELDYMRDVMYIYGVYIDDPVVRLYNLTLDRPVFSRVRLDMGIFNQISFPSYYNSKDGLLYNIAQAGSPTWPSLYLVSINPLTGKITALGSSLPFIQPPWFWAAAFDSTRQVLYCAIEKTDFPEYFLIAIDGVNGQLIEKHQVQREEFPFQMGVV